jgi:hypothetical protein
MTDRSNPTPNELAAADRDAPKYEIPRVDSPLAENVPLARPAPDSQLSDRPSHRRVGDAISTQQPTLLREPAPGQPPPVGGLSQQMGPPPGPAPPPEEASLLDLTPVLRQSPPWLVSAIIHMVLLIVLGLLFVKSMEDPRLLLDVMYAEDLGEQLIEEDLDQLLSETQMDFHEQLVTPEDLPEVIDPLATPELTEITPNPTVRAGTFEPTAIGLALTGRTVGHKNALLKAYGGDATTEGAVLLGLKWLQRQQQNSGLWSLKGPYTDGSRAENEEAATAMALLAFQGAGNTHTQGPFKREVAKAWEAMLERQSDDGNFYGNGPDHSRFYTEAQCTIGLCELFGMSQDESLRGPAQLAVDYLVKTQANNGGWRYDVGESGDLSVTGWVVMALQSARMAGLEVPSNTLERIREFLYSVEKKDGQRYAYRPRDGAKRSMTAEGLLCRQYLGWAHDDPRLQGGADYLVSEQNLPSWKLPGDKNVYYWYYATQVCHHMEGDWWKRWNDVMRQKMPETQIKRGRERGSWTPHGDRFGPQGGRLYVTCLSIYILEVYYRHLPIYQSGLLDQS